MSDDKTTRPSANEHRMSEYERSVLENVRSIQSEYAEVFGNVKQSADKLAKFVSNSAVDQRNSTVHHGGSNEKRLARNSQYSRQIETQSKPPSIVRRSARLKNEIKKSTSYNEQSDSDDDDENENKKRSKTMRFKFPWFKSSELKKRDEEYYTLHGDSDFIDSDEDYDDKDHKSGKPRIKRKYVSTSRLAVSQVTQEMLENIAYKSSGKQHSVNGTTCHQCRQKTLDQKSYCRYKECRGIRGMFCGFCLGKRYGEDVAQALLNPKWACPPCRGYCNCSICRRKQGRSPTGQLAARASASGFKSVRHMLCNMEGEGAEETENKSEDDNDDDFVDDENNCIEDNKQDTDQENNEEEEEEENISEGIKNNDDIDIVIAKPLKTDGLNSTVADNPKNEISDEEMESDEKTESSNGDINSSTNSDECSDDEMKVARDNIRFY